jgi:DNA-binding NarL/FixJ family response regulator
MSVEPESFGGGDSSSSPSPSLLIVDDDPNVREVLRMVARFDAGFVDIDTAGTSGEAIELAAARPPDVVILDHAIAGDISPAALGGMTTPTGMDLVSYFRDRLSDAVLVVHSGYSDLEVKGKEAGADLVVVKGSDLTDMFDAIRRIHLHR